MFSPWVWKSSPSILRLPSRPFSSVDEWYWSFQVALYNPPYGYSITPFQWNFWFSPYRVLLWDFWFSQDMYYYGFTYEWIRIFGFQLLSIVSGVWVLFRGWHKTAFMLLPISFSVISEFLGLLLVARFMFVWNGYANPAWGLPFAMFSTLFFVMLFFLRYGSEKLKRRAS